jgi:hypothetical protein
MYHWRSRGKRTSRDPIGCKQDAEQVKYSFGNGEIFDELHEIVSKFSPRQFELARETGFGVFADVRMHVRFDKKICLWLMGRMNHQTHTINLASGKEIRMFPEDVTKIFGLPHGGMVPWHHTLDKSYKTVSSITAKIGVTDPKESCNEAAENFLRTEANILTP